MNRFILRINYILVGGSEKEKKFKNNCAKLSYLRMDRNTISNILKGKGSSIRVGDIEISKEYLLKKGYESKRILGVGGCGVVVEAMNRKTMAKNAIKLILVIH